MIYGVLQYSSVCATCVGHRTVLGHLSKSRLCVEGQDAGAGRGQDLARRECKNVGKSHTREEIDNRECRDEAGRDETF